MEKKPTPFSFVCHFSSNVNNLKRVQTIRPKTIQPVWNSDNSAKSMQTIQPETIQPIIVTAAVAPTCCELANRGYDSIRNLEPVIAAKRRRARSAPTGDLKPRNDSTSNFFLSNLRLCKTGWIVSGWIFWISNRLNCLRLNCLYIFGWIVWISDRLNCLWPNCLCAILKFNDQSRFILSKRRARFIFVLGRQISMSDGNCEKKRKKDFEKKLKSRRQIVIEKKSAKKFREKTL